jgi:hypothetical protein
MEQQVQDHFGSAYPGHFPTAGFHCLVHIRSWAAGARFLGWDEGEIATAEQHLDGDGHPPLRWQAVMAEWLVVDDLHNGPVEEGAPRGRQKVHALLPRQTGTREAAAARRFLVRKRAGEDCGLAMNSPGKDRCGLLRGLGKLGRSQRHRRAVEGDCSSEWRVHGEYGMSRRMSCCD